MIDHSEAPAPDTDIVDFAKSKLYTSELNLLILGVNIMTLSLFRQECVRLTQAVLKPHAFCLVEVGLHSPSMTGYNIFQSERRKFGGTIIYLRKDLEPIKTDSGQDFASVIFRPNKDSIVAIVACYVSPNAAD